MRGSEEGEAMPIRRMVGRGENTEQEGCLEEAAFQMFLERDPELDGREMGEF